MKTVAGCITLVAITVIAALATGAFIGIVIKTVEALT